MVIFRFFGENCLKLELYTFVIHAVLIKNKEEDIKRTFQEIINHNLSFCDFSET